MAKVLKASFEKNCIGCELCVLEVQRQLEKVGLEGSPIRIFRSKHETTAVTYAVEVDPSVNDLNIEKIAAVCPTLVFTLEEETETPHELAG